MANVVTTFTPIVTYTQFVLPAGGSQDRTILPRGRIIFSGLDTVPLKEALDTSTIRNLISLPPNFAYALDSFYFSVFAAADLTDLDNVNNLGYALLEIDGTVDLLELQLQAQGTTIHLQTAAGSGKFFDMPQPYRELYYNLDGASPTLETFVFDMAAGETGILTTRLYNSWLIYDLEQVLTVQVNAPQPVRNV